MQATSYYQEALPGSYIERATRIDFSSQETQELQALLRELLHSPLYETLPQYQQELVENLFIRLTPKVLDAQSTKGPYPK